MFVRSAFAHRQSVYLALVWSFSLTAHANIVTPAPVAQTTAYRCQSVGGAFQYQQLPCESASQTELVRIADHRTDAQRKVADRQAESENQLAKAMSKERHQAERRSLRATAIPRSLTVQAKVKAPQPEPTTVALKVVPRKRDFRAVSAKPEGARTRRSSTNQAKVRSQGSNQPV